MKKVLFATTALVATAGVAAADVALTGSAEMGIVGGDDIETQFHTDIDARFNMSGETDNGISFGAEVDIDEGIADGGDAGDNDAAHGGAEIFISGDFGTLTMGDTDGALDFAMQETLIGSVDPIAADHEHGGYNGNSGLDGAYDGQILRYDYSVAGFDVAVSIEQDDERGGYDIFGINSSQTGDAIIGLGARYSFDLAIGEITAGAGYQFTTDYQGAVAGDQELSVAGVSLSAALDNGLSAAINYSVIDTFINDGDGEHFGIGASYNWDAITVHANYGVFDWDDNAAAADTEGFGLAAGYDLGGGLSAVVGYGWTDVTASNASGAAQDDSSTWSLGLSMSF